MSRSHKDARNYKQKERHISVRAVRRDPPDLRKLSRAIIAIALAEAEAEAQAEATQKGDAAAPLDAPTRREASDD